MLTHMRKPGHYAASSVPGSQEAAKAALLPCIPRWGQRRQEHFQVGLLADSGAVGVRCSPIHNRQG